MTLFKALIIVTPSLPCDIYHFMFYMLLKEQTINHPVLITECACNPVQSRSKMAELLFETYGVPSVAFGVDAAFSYKYNHQLGVCNSDGLAICSGFNTSHVIPFLNGEPVYEACCRTNVGGYHITDYLKQLLSLKYPHHMSKLTWEKVEDLKMEHCYIAPDYASEVRLFQKGDKKAEEKTKCWQLPWTPLPMEEAPSEEEIARKAALREKQGQRLREMAEAKRLNRINDLENEIRDLEMLLQRLRHATENDIPSILAKSVHTSRQDVESALSKATQSLRKAKGENVENVEKMDSSSSEKYNLINVPDEMLTPEQLKQKRKQLFIKSTSEARQQKKQKQVEEELERERQKKLEEERRLENPERYLEELRTKHRDLSEKVDQRKRLKTNGGHTNGNNNNNASGGERERILLAGLDEMELLLLLLLNRSNSRHTSGPRPAGVRLWSSSVFDNNARGATHVDLEWGRHLIKIREVVPTVVSAADAGGDASPNAPNISPHALEALQISILAERIPASAILWTLKLGGAVCSRWDRRCILPVRRGRSDRGILDLNKQSLLAIGVSPLAGAKINHFKGSIRLFHGPLTPVDVFVSLTAIGDATRGRNILASSIGFGLLSWRKADNCWAGKNLNDEYFIAATQYAKLQEASLEAVSKVQKSWVKSGGVSSANFQRSNKYNPVSNVRGVSQHTERTLPMRKLSPKEIEKRRKSGLCFHCVEPYTFGHKCRKLFTIVATELSEEESIDEEGDKVDEEEEDLAISVHALGGKVVQDTIKLLGNVKNNTISVLVDIGSSHSFLDPYVAKKTGYEVEYTNPMQVTVADGNKLECNTRCPKFTWNGQP
ncbi:hypothetical protein BUALT_Bualt06G0047200 [Buddleja alternifolia]|uniref:Actin-related protein 5 n=1 Tax=Buddleja alternifolia TaxID=168488 RepID=A0AAV6XK42_9LAMI|nr:hypothetical protein BUALT_Bualt06G0047200 [Buddleja alternifolia]